jgi:hypothetical protein
MPNPFWICDDLLGGTCSGKLLLPPFSAGLAGATDISITKPKNAKEPEGPREGTAWRAEMVCFSTTILHTFPVVAATDEGVYLS